VLLVGLAGAGCDGLLEVEAPSQVTPQSRDVPANASLLVNGAGADFECALAHYIVATGYVTNELEYSYTVPAGWDYERRAFQPSTSYYVTVTCDNAADGSVGIYRPLSTARYQGDETVRLLQQWSDAEVAGRAALIARAASYGGYSLLLLGEAMCSAAIDLGPELTPAQIFQLAEQRFTTALEAAQAASDANLVSWARVGRGRARLNLGRKAEASADAGPVPSGFRFDASYGSEAQRRWNVVWERNLRFNSATVGTSYRDVRFNGVADPRVRVTNSGSMGLDRVTPLWFQTKYTGMASPIRVATWEEAQLMIAEAAGGQTAINIINSLHTRAGLPPFSASTEGEIQAQVIEERRRELYLESHRLGDVRRYQTPLFPASGTPYRNGGTYTGQRCFALPDVERVNNPNI